MYLFGKILPKSEVAATDSQARSSIVKTEAPAMEGRAFESAAAGWIILKLLILHYTLLLLQPMEAKPGSAILINI